MSKNLISFDWAMKKLLRSKANFGILEGFLSELLKQDLKILNLLESESNKNHREDKQNRVDLIVQLQNGEIVLIEVQVSSEHDYFHRMLYETSRVVTEYLKESEKYAMVKKVYSVHILYFDLGHGKDYIYHGTTRFLGLHQKDELSLSEKQKEVYTKEQIFQIYPEYYLIKVNQFNDVAKDTLDEWIYFLKNEEIKDNFHAKGLLEAKDKLSELKLSDDEKEAYRIHVKEHRIQAGEFDSSYGSGVMDGEKKGLEKGLKKGEKIGIEKGKQLGKQEGKQEAQIEIAKKMKQSGMTDEMILQITGIDLNHLTQCK